MSISATVASSWNALVHHAHEHHQFITGLGIGMVAAILLLAFLGKRVKPRYVVVFIFVLGALLVAMAKLPYGMVGAS